MFFPAGGGQWIPFRQDTSVMTVFSAEILGFLPIHPPSFYPFIPVLHEYCLSAWPVSSTSDTLFCMNMVSCLFHVFALFSKYSINNLKTWLMAPLSSAVIVLDGHPSHSDHLPHSPSPPSLPISTPHMLSYIEKGVWCVFNWIADKREKEWSVRWPLFFLQSGLLLSPSPWF